MKATYTIIAILALMFAPAAIFAQTSAPAPYSAEDSAEDTFGEEEEEENPFDISEDDWDLKEGSHSLTVVSPDSGPNEGDIQTSVSTLSASSGLVTVYALNGRPVTRIQASEGLSGLNLPHGIYIIEGRKLRL